MYFVEFHYTTVFIAWQGENCSGNGRGGAERNGAERNGAVRKMSGRGEQGEAVGRGRKVARWSRKGRQGEGSGGVNNACNFWGRVVRESPVLYDFVYYKAIFMEL